MSLNEKTNEMRKDCKGLTEIFRQQERNAIEWKERVFAGGVDS